MPMTIASCWREPSRPRILAGEISAMYADAETADDAEDDQNPEVGSESGSQRADQEEHRGNSHDGQPPEVVRDPAGAQGSGRRAEQR